MQNHAFVLRALARRPGGPLGPTAVHRPGSALDDTGSLRLALGQLNEGEAKRA